MKKGLLSSLFAIAATVAILAIDPIKAIGQGQPPEGKGGKGGGGGGGAVNPQLYGPYYTPPVRPGGPVGRLPDGKPDLQGFYAGRFGNAVFNVEDETKGKGKKGPIVDPPGGQIPYKPEARAKREDMEKNHMFEEPEAHCFQS